MEGTEEALLLRSYELRLLRCSLPSPSPSDSDLPKLTSPPPQSHSHLTSPPPQSHSHRLSLLIEDILALIESGRYVEALSSDAAQLAFQRLSDSVADGGSVEAAEFYAELELAAESFMEENGGYGSVLVMSIAVAAFFAFVQCNMTGSVKQLPLVPLPFKGIQNCDSWEVWAWNQLMSAGSNLIGKFAASQGRAETTPMPSPMSQGEVAYTRPPLGGDKDFTLWKEEQCGFSTSTLLVCMRVYLSKEQKVRDIEKMLWDVSFVSTLLSHCSLYFVGKFELFIVFAKVLLTKSKDVFSQKDGPNLGGTRSISWWLVRCLHLQQRMLDDRCSSLFDLLQACLCESLNHFGDVERVANYWGGLLCNGEAFTIVSMLHLEAGLVEHTFARVDSAREHFKSAELGTGLEISLTGALGYRTVHQVEPKALMVLRANRNASFSGTASSHVNTSSDKGTVENSSQKQEDESSVSDVLMTPRFVDNGENSVNDIGVGLNSNDGDMVLNAIQQLVVLAQCLLIEKSARQDEIQRWKMAPYIEAIDSQQSSCFIIRCFCNILRVRWESTRSRTKERSLLMMDKLVQDLFGSQPEVQERIYYCFGVYIPMIPALRKEYGELLVSQGLVGEALSIFEDLELWDNLIHCYCLLEKKAAAVELIKKRLSETPNDSRLWCSLGDVTIDDACYHRALEVSNDRCARAKRSLARSAYNRGEYETSKLLWESAMALNSLYPDGWFALGAAALKARDVEKALDGFTRSVQLDPDNGEAWNNIACLHMIKKRDKEASIAFKEALKFKRGSWQMWENYSYVAANIGNFAQAMEAIQKVFDLSRGNRIDTALLGRILEEMERRVGVQGSQFRTPDCGGAIQAAVPEAAVSRETENLIEVLGKLLQQIVRSNAAGDVWGLYARWHKMKGDLSMCSEALLKQVRSYQGADLWKDSDRFKKFAHASLDLCEVYMAISSSTGSLRELRAAEMHLRNTIKQASSAFSDTEELKELEICLNEVKVRLESNAAPAS